MAQNDPTPKPAYSYANRRPAEDRFWEKVDKHGPNGCWLWLASCDRKGYGSFNYTTAHRFSHRLRYGLMADGLHLHHLCEVPACVNPEHLQALTVSHHAQIPHSRGIRRQIDRWQP